MPLRDIEDKYTLSEITLMAWRSQEQAYQMRSKMAAARANTPRKAIDAGPVNKNEQRITGLEQVAESFDKPLEDSKGNFTLKHQSGENAAKFLASMGFAVSSMG